MGPQSRVGGGGGVLGYFYTYVGSGQVLGFKNLNFNICWFFFWWWWGGGGVQKKYFLGYEDFVDIFGGSSQNWTIFRGHFYAF